MSRINLKMGEMIFTIHLDDDNLINILLYEYSEWFSVHNKKNSCKAQIFFNYRKKNNTNIDIIKYFNLKNFEIIGENVNKQEKIIKQYNNMFLVTHLFNNEIIFVSLSLTTMKVDIFYFSTIAK